MKRDLIEARSEGGPWLEEENHGGGRSCGVADCYHVPCVRRRRSVVARPLWPRGAGASG